MAHKTTDSNFNEQLKELDKIFDKTEKELDKEYKDTWKENAQDNISDEKRAEIAKVLKESTEKYDPVAQENLNKLTTITQKRDKIAPPRITPTTKNNTAGQVY